MIYFVFNFTAFFFQFSKYKDYNFTRILFFLSLLFFLGARYGWGLDFSEYFKEFYLLNNKYTDIFSIFNDTWIKVINDQKVALAGREPFYILLMIVSSNISDSILGFNLLAQSIILTNFYIFCNKSKNFWLSLSICLPFIIFIGTDVVRQFIAISFVIASLSFFFEKKLFYALILVLIPPLFHFPSAIYLMLIPFYLMDFKYILRFLLLVVAFYFLFFLYNGYFIGMEQINFYAGEYRLGSYAGELGYSRYLYVFITGIVLMTLLYLNAFYKVNFIKTHEEKKIFLFLVILFFVSLFALFAQPVAGYRISLYLIPLFIYFASKIPELSVKYHTYYSTIICMMSIMLVFLWINFSNGRYVYLPYKNMIFDKVKKPPNATKYEKELF